MISARGRAGRTLSASLIVVAAALGLGACAHEPDYRAVDGAWGELPNARIWGQTNAVYPDVDGMSMWVAERCGDTTCVGKDDIDPVVLFDSSGHVLKSFGAGLFVWPHGIYVDYAGNIWVTDGKGENGKGHQVHKFTRDGLRLMSLGTAGVAGETETTFNRPSAVLVAPDGAIFVADGHRDDGNSRMVKFAPDGSFIKTWGKPGAADGELKDPHALAMDSQGRLFVADRGNNRIQIFDQDGNHLASWTQFGRPSGLFIDADDVLYVSDSESNSHVNPGRKRGIWIGKAKTGKVTGFIPDNEPDPEEVGTSGAEGVAADAAGNVYGAQVKPRMVTKYVKE